MRGIGRNGKSNTKLGQSRRQDGAGLTNLANTCYMNSVLQSIFHAASYRCEILNTTFSEDSIGEKLNWLFNEMMDSTCVNPRELARALDLNVGTQEDAQEFLLRLLHETDDSVLPAKINDIETTTASTATPAEGAAVAPATNHELPSYAFRGYTEQTIQCTNVDFSKTRKQKFLDLTVDIVGFQNLKDALLDMFTRPDLLTGPNQYRAAEPYGLQDAEKRLRLVSLPSVLCVTLKRFRYDSDLGTLKKIGDPLEFPDALDMSKYAHVAVPVNEGDGQAQVQAQAQSQSQYLLNSVVVHEGTATFGHYTCYARSDPSMRPDYWLLFNDHMVSEVSYDQVCKASFGNTRGSSSAYLLFYSKR